MLNTLHDSSHFDLLNNTTKSVLISAILLMREVRVSREFGIYSDALIWSPEIIFLFLTTIWAKFLVPKEKNETFWFLEEQDKLFNSITLLIYFSKIKKNNKLRVQKSELVFRSHHKTPFGSSFW